MAEKKKIELEISNNIDEVNKDLQDVVKTLEDVKEQQEKVNDAVESNTKSTNALRDAFKGLGLAIKGAGIAVAIEAFAQLKDVIASNQGITDKFNVGLNTTKIVFNDLVSTFTNWEKLKALMNTTISGNFLENAKNYFKGAYETSQQLVKLENQVRLAIVKQAGLVEQFDIQAERQRQLRDDESKSISDRIKANDKLKVVLDNQAAAMTLMADKQIELAELNVKINNNIENQVALQEALNNKQAINAQITGFRSEQIVNRIALLKEEDALDVSATDSALARVKSRIDTNTSLIKNEQDRRIEEIFQMQQTGEFELKLLDERRKKYMQGTQARVDADEAYRTKSQELDNNLKIKRDELETYLLNSHLNNLSIVYSNELEAYSTRLKALDEYNQAAQKSTQLSEDEKRRISMETYNQQKIIERQRISMVANTLGNISSLFDAASTEGKAFAVAQSLINTYQGITAELATKTATPFEFGLKIANVATVAAMGFKAVKDIINTQPSTSFGGMEMTGATPASAAPQFNVVGASGINQVAQTINKQANTPVKAYVVSKDVTTAQSLDRNIVSAASM
jgi:hypothetical protein